MRRRRGREEPNQIAGLQNLVKSIPPLHNRVTLTVIRVEGHTDCHKGKRVTLTVIRVEGHTDCHKGGGSH